MKRKSLLICFAVCLFFLLVAPVFAHPGGTDGRGGHTNHSTGEYHYHHGYSAHDHYDMDGDGVVDCPYDFKDNTKHSPYAPDNNSSKESQNVKETEEVTETTEYESTISEYEENANKARAHKKRMKILSIIYCVSILPLSWVVFIIFMRIT